MLGLQRANIPGQLMVKLFSKNSNLCDHNSPTSQTDRQTTCDRNTALCTKVHRAVKKTLRMIVDLQRVLARVVMPLFLYLHLPNFLNNFTGSPSNGESDLSLLV